MGSAINRMMTERGMAAPAAGGSVLADFDTILAAVVPELAGRVQAVAFDADTGRLDVVPDAPAARTKLRWSAPKLIATANERVSGANVRALHVLAPAPVEAGPATAAAEVAPHPTAPAAPMQRPDPPEGYREAIAAHRATWGSRQHTSPEIQAAAERRHRERLREPEENFADGRQALEELRAKAAAQQRVRPSDASQVRALQRLAAERAGLTTITPAAAPQRLDPPGRAGPHDSATGTAVLVRVAPTVNAAPQCLRRGRMLNDPSPPEPRPPTPSVRPARRCAAQAGGGVAPGSSPEKAHRCSMVHTATLERSVDIRSHTSSPPGMSATSRCASSHVPTGYIHSMPSGHVRIATVRTLSAALGPPPAPARSPPPGALRLVRRARARRRRST
ncbi:DciA family protein [Streptomyces sp. NPDC006270]|uniref:DciA family protein n=1 Tax=Streptomyces sp. NPDC006270 TaxID=3364741 RepID=UPI0036815FC9